MRPFSRPVPSRPVHRERERAPDPGDPFHAIEHARRVLRRGYADRYQAATGEPWMSEAAHHESIGIVAAWCVSQASPEDAAMRALDGFFGSDRTARHRWPWRFLAEDPGSWAAQSTSPTSTTTTALEMALQAANVEDF